MRPDRRGKPNKSPARRHTNRAATPLRKNRRIIAAKKMKKFFRKTLDKKFNTTIKVIIMFLNFNNGEFFGTQCRSCRSRNRKRMRGAAAIAVY